jgi:2-C-methyl-D-erythritol 2,4-cyclodiphosphate synthase/2-C-methyl-D-erythritol 4-phosphate cytidylyltransferase
MVVAVIVAAGRATRMAGAAGPDKNLLNLLGKPVLRRCLDVFDACAAVDGVVVVTAEERVAQYRQLAGEWGNRKLLGVVPGGDTRTASVAAGLAALPQGCDVVAIHDCARPFVTAEIIERTIESARNRGSGVAAIASRDTIKQADGDGLVLHTPPREALRLVQTPQTFRADALHAAYDALGDGACATDDAGLLEASGQPVYLVEGSVDNIKLTTPEDIAHGEAILRARGEKLHESESSWGCQTMTGVERLKGIQEVVVLPRIGEGFDVHRLVEDRKLILGGVEVPHHLGLLGHSDADVLAHAIMDALLGAAALGDIGKHFPDSDEAWRGADSLVLLRHVAALLAQNGYAIGNVDATVAAQRPRLAPHIPQMRVNLAEAMGVPVDRVSVKATTTERLGYEGREEGISARAVALLIARP